jgi:hypothetical protein
LVSQTSAVVITAALEELYATAHRANGDWRLLSHPTLPLGDARVCSEETLKKRKCLLTVEIQSASRVCICRDRVGAGAVDALEVDGLPDLALLSGHRVLSQKNRGRRLMRARPSVRKGFAVHGADAAAPELVPGPRPAAAVRDGADAIEQDPTTGTC